MNKGNIKINYETIGVSEQRDLIETTQAMARALTKDDYMAIMLIYKDVIDRVVEEAEKQGIEV